MGNKTFTSYNRYIEFCFHAFNLTVFDIIIKSLALRHLAQLLEIANLFHRFDSEHLNIEIFKTQSGVLLLYHLKYLL